jgi:hypothetical protein
MPEFFDLPIGAKSQFPSHGWIEGKTGFRHLRFPLLRVFQFDHPAYEKYQAHGLGGVWLQTRSPYRTLRQLSIALRDLHAELRLLLAIVDHEWLDREVSEARNVALTQQSEGLERCEVLLLSIFVLLRRLADDVMDSLRPALFEHWRSAPEQLKSAVALAQTRRLHSLKPYCDADALSTALITNSTWLQRLRKEDGIRDTLIHRPHLLQVGPHGTKPADSERFSWQITASMIVLTRDGVRAKNLFPVLLECLAGACEFMTSISRLIPGTDDFERGDVMPLTGHDNDIVGFWPAIGGGQNEFPLRK